MNNFSIEGYSAGYWTSDKHPSQALYAAGYGIGWIRNSLQQHYTRKGGAMAVRFVRDAQTASTKDYSKPTAIYANPTSSIVTIKGGAYNIEVYSL